MQHHDYGEIPVVDAYTTDDAIGDGVLLDLAALAPTPQTRRLHEIGSIDEYLQSFGRALGRKAIHALNPLHVPGRDPLPAFEDLLREPFPCQQHVVAAAVKMMDERGSGFLVGECGTGKTLLGMAAVHKHAQRSRRQGGSGGKYRAIVLCPDHLIAKWAREIQDTLPGATVHRFGPQGPCDDAPPPEPKRRSRGEPKEKTEGGTRKALRDTVDLLRLSRGHRWAKPQGAGQHAVSSKTILLDREPLLDEFDRPVRDASGTPVTRAITARVHYCPRCGTVCRDKKGVPLAARDLSVASKNTRQKRCLGTYLQAIADPDHPEAHGLDRLCPVPGPHADKAPGQSVNHLGTRWVVRACGEPLFHYTSRPYRWSPARIIQKKLSHFFKYLVIDEIHEHKSDSSAQSMAAGKLMATIPHVLALTGTIIGGYADHLFPLMMRINPATLRDEGFEWGKDLPFSEVYGRIDRIVTVREEAETSVRGNVRSMRRARTGNASERKAVRPGIMPTLFGRHLIGNAMFITLEELADELPDLFEYTGGPPQTMTEGGSIGTRMAIATSPAP